MKLTVTIWVIVGGVSRPASIVVEQDYVQVEEHYLTWTSEGRLSSVEIVCVGREPDPRISALVAAYFAPR